LVSSGDCGFPRESLKPANTSSHSKGFRGALTSQTEIIGAQFDRRTAKLLREVCSDRGEGISSFVRRAVRKELASLSYLSDREKKSLGSPVEPEIQVATQPTKTRTPR